MGDRPGHFMPIKKNSAKSVLKTAKAMRCQEMKKKYMMKNKELENQVSFKEIKVKLKFREIQGIQGNS